jgi:FK506-binding nuclear protein
MAAIDPEAMPEYEDSANASKPPRATLKIVRPPPGLDFDDDSEDDDDYEDDEDEEDDLSSEDEENGGPSDRAKMKQAMKAAALKDMEDAMDEDDSEADDEVDLKAAISKLIKGKAKATDDDDSDTSDGPELEELVVCTLDPEKVCLATHCYCYSD